MDSATQTAHPSDIPMEDNGVSWERGGSSLRSAVAMAGIWAVTAGAALWLDNAVVARFLDLPLSAYLAGQGALMAAVMVSIRLAAPADSAPAP